MVILAFLRAPLLELLTVLMAGVNLLQFFNNIFEGNLSRRAIVLILDIVGNTLLELLDFIFKLLAFLILIEIIFGH